MSPVAVTAPREIAAVARLARVIWTEHYTPIIGSAQVEYMLRRIQSEAAIAAQIADGYEYFLIPGDGDFTGYYAIQARPSERTLFLSKLYVLEAARGRGLGVAAVGHVASLARERGLERVTLTVNKHNPALKAYQRMGFAVVSDVVADIGEGYVMDDYLLEKAV